MKTIFIYILIFHCFIYNKLIIPIYKKTYNYNSIESFIFNNYLSNISIGNPQQKIECNIRLDSPQFIIKSKELNGIYNKNLSNSYYSFDNTLKTYFWGPYYYTGIESKEKISFNKEKNFYDLNFILINNISNELNFNYNCSIGLRINDMINNNEILIQLKNQKIIDNYIIFINLNNNNKNEIIIGDFPKNLNYKLINAKIKRFSFWEINFDNIYFGNLTDIYKECDFSFNFNGIIGSSNYHEYVKNIFFNNYLNKKLCFTKIIYKNKYISYVCSDKINFNNFESLNFESYSLNETFIFNYNDLFHKEGNQYYFLVIFQLDRNNKWIFGELFLKKNKIFFDYNKKIVGISNEMKLIEEKNKYFNFEYKILIYFVFINIIILFFLYKLMKFCNKPKYRKNKINELSEIDSKNYKFFNFEK